MQHTRVHDTLVAYNIIVHNIVHFIYILVDTYLAI